MTESEKNEEDKLCSEVIDCYLDNQEEINNIIQQEERKQ